jgi:hypothetical protein
MSLVTGPLGLNDTTCHCGAHKPRARSFCVHCYRSLTSSQQHALYRFVGAGYEEAHASAIATLRKNGRVKPEEDPDDREWNRKVTGGDPA